MYLGSYILITVLLSVEASPLKESDRLHEHAHHRVKRVIGGEPIMENEWPYLVRLRADVPQTFFGIPYNWVSLYCGGSIINHRWILTAAHCFTHADLGRTSETPKYWHIKAGKIKAHDHIWDTAIHKLSQWLNQPDWEVWTLHAETIVIHPSYNEAEMWHNDIALVKLEDDLPTNGSHENIGPVRLPARGLDRATWPADDQRCIMKGWGCTAAREPLEDVARAVNLTKVSDRLCGATYGVGTRSRLCAGGYRQNIGICSGDSGGPLVCEDPSTGAWTQAGVASFTSAGFPENYPGVFTRVSEYEQWINAVISVY